MNTTLNRRLFWPVLAALVLLVTPGQPRYSEKFLNNNDPADIHSYLSSIKAGPKARDIPLLSTL